MNRRAGRRSVVLAACVALSLTLPAIAPANFGPHGSGPIAQRYEHVWRVQSEVGGDIGGQSSLWVEKADTTMKAASGGYTGTVTYSDVLAVEDPQGGVLVQASSIRLELTGSPAGGGAAAGGLFEGTIKLDDYVGLSWDEATTKVVPDTPSRSATYAVAGRWGAYLSGSNATGELLYETAAVQSRTGPVDVRDVTWFNRFGSGRAQRFTAVVQGAVASGGTAAGPQAGDAGVADFVAAGLTGDSTAGSLPAVALESAAAATVLRDSKPVGAVAVPEGSVSIDLDVSGLLLEAKNRAAGLGPDTATGEQAGEVWRRARTSVVEESSESSPSASVSPTQTALAALLEQQKTIPGAAELAGQVAAVSVEQSSAVRLVSERLLAARAIGTPGESVLRATAQAAAEVRDAEVPRSGPAADALLADADSPSAPSSSLTVTRFTRSAKDDVAFIKDGKRVFGDFGLMRAVLSFGPLQDGAPELTYSSPRGTSSVSPDVWLGYERASDETLFWLGGEDGEVALRDGSLNGWAFRSGAARLVSSSRVGQTLAILRDGEPFPVTR